MSQSGLPDIATQDTHAGTSLTQWPIYGHEWAVRLLQQSSLPIVRGSDASGGPKHAYLFLGPTSIGKTTLAKTFAQALLCTDSRARPCGQCRACRLVASGNHPDFRFVQPQNRDGNPDRADGMLRVEQASDLIHEATLRPMEGRYKIFVVQDAHTANDSFSNKLLKTLEEPPDQVVLLLTALERRSLLPTIVSRCQVVELRPLAADVIRDALSAGWPVNAERAALLARLANGRLGWAVRQLDDQAGAEWRRGQLAELLRLVGSNRIERLNFSESVAAGRDNAQLFEMLALWTSWWRDVLLVQTGCGEQCCNIDYPDEIERHAKMFDSGVVVGFLHRLHHVEGLLHHTVNTRLAMDVLLLHLPGVEPPL